MLNLSPEGDGIGLEVLKEPEPVDEIFDVVAVLSDSELVLVAAAVAGPEAGFEALVTTAPPIVVILAKSPRKKTPESLWQQVSSPPNSEQHQFPPLQFHTPFAAFWERLPARDSSAPRFGN